MDGRIVVGVDGSQSSRRALHWAAGQAKLTGASLEVVNCWEIPSVEPSDLPLASTFGDDVRRNLQETITEVLGDEPGVEITVSAVEGRAAPALLDAARGASLLVVGSRGHAAFTGMLLGSVSEHCVRHAPCPVVVVRGEDDHDRGGSG
jgi:nucleotide-binding universal stress UspA family protein